LWLADAFISDSLYSVWAWCKRAGSAYSSFLYRYFALTGLKKTTVNGIDHSLTLGTVLAFGLLAYALPPFAGTGDVWNERRQHAVTLTDGEGTVIGQRGIRQDDNIPLEEMPPHVIQAVLATEDARFFDHFGVDVIGTFRAALRNARSEKVQGGSSITQQVAKNLFLSPEQTLQRKIHEAFLSLWIEARLTKEEILKLYLDRSYLGGGNYGVEAAAQYYFGKSIRDVNLQESAIIAGLFKAPTNYAPHKDLEAALGRAGVVLWRMVDAGYISQGEMIQARRQTPTIFAKKDVLTPDWFLDYAFQNTLDILEEQGLQREYVIEVKTTIDRKLQIDSQAIMNDVLTTQGPAGNFTQGASVTMAPDGAVRAIVGGRDYETSQFNRATDAERQSGSSFKPFVYLAALLNGFTPEDTIVDSPVSIGGWSPGNYDGKYGGRVTLRTALAKSYNSIPVKLLQAIGRPAITQAARDTGIEGKLDTWPTMVLGTSSLTLLDLSTGYATLANNGKLARPYAVLEIRRPNGDILYQHDKAVSPAPQVVPETTIEQLNTMLGAVVTSGTGRGADIGIMPTAGKTGTNQGYRDAWYVGYSAHFVTGVWVGNDDFSPMNEITGGRVPAPAWKRIMEVAEAGQAIAALPGLPITEANLKFAEEQEKLKAEAKVVAEEPNAVPPDAETKLSNAIYVPSADEQPANTPDLVAGAQSSDQVLNNMFKVFERKPTQVVKPKRAARNKVARRTIQDTGGVYGEGRAERRQQRGDDGSFIDNLFKTRESSPKRKKKKKKDFFFFDF
jgi:penicillin-binding protein 1A